MDEVIVSVVMPVYNEEKHIEGCIESLLAQTYPKENMEWIFVDGMSTDRTLEKIEKYRDCGPITILENPQKKTPYALNIGVQKAKGKYILRMDAHAMYAPNYIERCVFYLDTIDAENVGGIAETSAEGFIGEAIAKMVSTKFGVGNSNFRIGSGDKYVDTVPMGAFRRTVFEKVGLYNTSLLRSEDNDLNARIRNSGGKIWLAEDIRFKYCCRDTVGAILKMGMQNGNALFRTFRHNPKAMSMRHFIPFVFLLSLVIMPILSVFPIFFWLFMAEILAYLLLDAYFSFCKGSFKYGFVNVWLYPLFHVSYGLGSLLGLFGIRLY